MDWEVGNDKIHLGNDTQSSSAVAQCWGVNKFPGVRALNAGVRNLVFLYKAEEGAPWKGLELGGNSRGKTEKNKCDNECKRGWENKEVGRSVGR